MSITILPEPGILSSASSGGHVYASVDEDGICRRVPLLARVEGRLVPSMGLAAAMQVLGVEKDDLELVDEHSLRVGPLIIPVDGEGNLYVNFIEDGSAPSTIAAMASSSNPLRKSRN